VLKSGLPGEQPVLDLVVDVHVRARTACAELLAEEHIGNSCGAQPRHQRLLIELGIAPAGRHRSDIAHRLDVVRCEQSRESLERMIRVADGEQRALHALNSSSSGKAAIIMCSPRTHVTQYDYGTLEP
jgi:hypothetical protein